MKIHLHEIPEEGKTWICNRQTAELNEPLKDLIQNCDYQVEFTILPMQSGTFQISGKIRGAYNEDCSRCGDLVEFGILGQFRDLLMPFLDEPRNSHYSRSNHVSDLLNEGPEVFNYSGNVFKADEFFHEKFAIEQPIAPAPGCDASGNCSICRKHVEVSQVVYDEPMETRKKSPFEGLKTLKLN
jgi:uncharacterized protein